MDKPEQIYQFELTDSGFFSREDLDELTAHCHPKKNLNDETW